MAQTKVTPENAIPLYLMAKVPVPGKVKTRMRPQLDAAQSAKLAQFMLEQTAQTACDHWPGRVILCVLPDLDHPIFRLLTDRHQIAAIPQQGADLGARMLAALRQGVARAGAAAVMGCDVPHCPGEILVECHQLLVCGENPVGPAVDGGFYLLGLQLADESLFGGMDGHGPMGLAAVRERAARARLALTELPPLRDIDQYADLQWLAGMDATYAPFLTDPTPRP